MALIVAAIVLIVAAAVLFLIVSNLLVTAAASGGSPDWQVLDDFIIIPPILLLVSGACLLAFFLLQARQGRGRLETTRATTPLPQTEDLRALVEAVPISTIIIDPRDQTPSFVNPAAEALIDPALDHPDWERLISAAFEAARLGDGARGTLKTTFVKRNGDMICLRGEMRSVIFEGRTQTLLALADTTRLRNADLQLLQAAKLAMLGEVGSAISHELNQPLAVIRMAVANAQRMLLEGDMQAIAGKLDRVSCQVERAKRIIDQVRRYGQAPADSIERFSLRHAIELAIGFVAEQYRTSGIRLTIELDIAPDVKVEGRQALFEQVIVNLLVNARDAFEEKAAERTPSVWLRARGDRSEAIIEVEDDAGGISEEMLLKLFEPFSTSKPDGHRTGLGLSMARRILRDMNGQISAGNIWSGACFTVTVPLCAPECAKEAA